jgi:flagellar hook-basal body complex protein FliE
MTQITPEHILAQMRRLSEIAQSPANVATQPSNNTDFTNALTQALQTVNKHQMEASQAAQRIEAGDGGVSLVKAVIAAQKASVAFDAAVQVRNRVVSAYQDIMNMPI